jgi:hypothetical protein
MVAIACPQILGNGQGVVQLALVGRLAAGAMAVTGTVPGVSRPRSGPAYRFDILPPEISIITPLKT